MQGGGGGRYHDLFYANHEQRRARWSKPVLAIKVAPDALRRALWCVGARWTWLRPAASSSKVLAPMPNSVFWFSSNSVFLFFWNSIS